MYTFRAQKGLTQWRIPGGGAEADQVPLKNTPLHCTSKFAPKPTFGLGGQKKTIAILTMDIEGN